MRSALKRRRPLIRYAGSAAETSIGSKPIGTELGENVYTRMGICEEYEPLRQSHEAIEQNGQNIGVPFDTGTTLATPRVERDRILTEEKEERQGEAA